MRKILRILSICVLLILPVSAAEAEYLVPVGKLIGLQLQSDTVTVAAFDDALGNNARAAGLRIGDELVTVNGVPIRRACDVTGALEKGGMVTLCVRRGGKEKVLRFTAADDGDGPRLGVYLRQGIAGVGTVTWYDPEEGTFGALGHGVAGGRGTLLNMTEGYAYDATIQSVIPGKPGVPGQLKGASDVNDLWGQLTRNTHRGVFGTTQVVPHTGAIPVADWEQIHTGPATIRSTVTADGPRDYRVEIVRLYDENRTDGRNFLLKITDLDLLAITGGIVQGMSGSPILQDGKIVGAVTHVLVNDPTMGYGIFIENMLEAAG